MNKVRELREEKKWTQDELGLRLNVRRSAISKYEAGKIPLTDETLKQLSIIFNVSIDYILGISHFRQENQVIPKEETFPLSLMEDECEILNLYRQLDRRGQARLLITGYEELDRVKGGQGMILHIEKNIG